MADTESQPAFSPDGNQVVYASRDGQTKRELFVKLIAGGPPLRLPSAEPNNFNPAWSPDGREIAFIRGYPHDLAIMTMAALGGAERLVGRVDDTGLDERLMTWRPDQKALIASDRTPDGREVALWALPLDGSRRQKLTSPPSGYSDMAPVFSPDGGTLAFLRRALVKREVYVMGKTGPERRLTFEDKPLESLTWAADGRSLLFNEREVTGPALWKVSAAGGSAQRIANIGNDAINIALAGKVNRLVYVRNPSERRDIWKLGGNAGFHAPTKLIGSAGVNQAPAFSPDGAHIAFSSTRGGTMEIWLADSGGNNPVPLTSIGRGVTGSARWSPDGRWIVFDSRPKDYAAIFVISATGGRTREVLRGAVPAWSHDGRWIYYSSDQQIWRVPADGGAPAQVTQHGGFECMASSDGRYLYYTKPPSHAGFWRIPVAGGEENETAELRSISRNRYWTVTATGIYFLDGDFAPNSESRAALKLLRFSTGRVEVVASPVPPSLSMSRGLAVSPDERTFLWVQPGESIFQIMLVEGFH